MDLPALADFNLVATHGGFGRASRSSGRPMATLSRKVSELEAALGVRLTDEGRALHELTQGPLGEIAEAEQAGRRRVRANYGSARRSSWRMSCCPRSRPTSCLLTRKSNSRSSPRIARSVRSRTITISCYGSIRTMTSGWSGGGSWRTNAFWLRPLGCTSLSGWSTKTVPAVGDIATPTYILQPGNHAIAYPDSCVALPADLPSCLAKMKPSFRHLLSVAVIPHGRHPELIIDAFIQHLVSLSPQYNVPYW